MNMNRRSLITGLISLAAAPAIVRAESLMPVRAVKWSGEDVTFTARGGLITPRGGTFSVWLRVSDGYMEDGWVEIDRITDLRFKLPSCPE